MVKEQGRSIDRMVEEQISKWLRLRSKANQGEKKVREVITISRQPGTKGTEIAEKLAKILDMDFFSGEIIKQVADSAKMSEAVVASLDERDIALREDWLKVLLDSNHLWPDQYLTHLLKVITTIGNHGNAVIVGRGANYILPPEQALRIRIISPDKDKIATIVSERGLVRGEAEKYVSQTESDRNAFVLKYFHVDANDPSYYDLVIDSSRFGVSGSVELIRFAFNEWKNAPKL